MGLLLLAAQRSAAELEDPALRAQRNPLANGLTVLTLEDHTTPVVSFQIWVKAGSVDEQGYTGLAHLFEHMMFRGSERLGPEQHAKLVQSRGGQLNAYTTRDQTVYFENVPAEALPLVIDLEAERFGSLVLDEEVLTSEREVVLEERRLRTEDNPRGRAQEAIFALAYQAHPYRWPVIGWRSDVEAVTLEACKQFFSTYYAPNNIVIAVVGDFESGPVLERIRRRFGGLAPAPRIPRSPTREPEQRGERRQIVHFDLRGPILTMAWHAPESGHPDAEALDVASQILSGGRASRLYRKLVYEEQTALSAYGAFFEMRRAGLFFAQAAVRPEARIEEVERSLLAEIERLREEPVLPEELEKAKRQLEVSLVRGLRTNSNLASRIAYDVVSFDRIRPLNDRLSAIRSVSAEDVQRVARAYLGAERRSVVHVVAPETRVP